MMNKFIYRLGLTSLLIFIFISPSAVKAQGQTDNPVYIVQSGDTLSSISQRFGVSVDALIKVNNITDPNNIPLGARLIIPGLEGVHGVLYTETIPLGANLRGLSLRYQLSQSMITRLNHITSPEEIYAGSNLILPQNDNAKKFVTFATVNAGQSLFEMAVIKNQNPWKIVDNNNLNGTWDVISGESLYSPAEETNAVDTLSPYLVSVDYKPSSLKQGSTLTVNIKVKTAMEITGLYDGNELHFMSNGDNQYTALQGIHAMAEPGLHPLKFRGTSIDGPAFEFEQMLLITPGDFSQESLIVDPATIDPNVTGPEDKKLQDLVQTVTPTRYWKDKMDCPVDPPICIKSWYGTRRTYNGGTLTSFHAGLDFGVCSNLNIYSPSEGIVVYVGSLTVRGNTTIIDHGWGVYSGLYHQSDIKVKTGDHVNALQIIGLIGETGRVTGPHLHYDLWVNGVQVNPLDWLAKTCQ